MLGWTTWNCAWWEERNDEAVDFYGDVEAETEEEAIMLIKKEHRLAKGIVATPE